MIYDILGVDSFKCRRITKYIRELYGLPYLLDLCCKGQDKPGLTFNNVIEIIQTNKIIPDAKLKSFLDKTIESKKDIEIHNSPEENVLP